ncbi:MAG: bifunctional phosphoribosylaminoimidazolecarboxamide formyltransferase/IMP cyclohydrolase [Lachnospiraceae bacterium]|nr:bifunctional phosphoribosylaminoimidazolecarboxamide formyltransferase/IMP cyclohydrolase [Lachnospiraceae bacterium]
MKRVLISVSDKTGIVDFSKKLVENGYEIVSTGGTATALKDAGLPVIGISEVTGFPECLDGRVKTLHPAIHAGLLAMRDNKEHMEQIEKLNIKPIDMVVVNLYPFKQTVLKEGVTREEAIENIDIGGPTMLRAAAKNWQDVAVVTNPADYDGIIAEIVETGDISKKTKFELSAKVFAHTAHYDSLIASYMAKQAGFDLFTETMSLTYEKVQDMRYGENPHQRAAFYKEIGAVKGSLAAAKQLHGKELSFNNINDANGALELLKEYEEPTVVACKHANPCGVGSADTIHEAYLKAYNSDPVSVFGGIIVANREVDEATATEINKIFVEIVVAPSFTEKAIEVLSAKANIRLLELPSIMEKQPADALDIKKVAGGILVQEVDRPLLGEELKVVTKRKPTEKEMEDMLFAWKMVKFTKSNGIAIGKDKQSVGIGPGQVNRIWACKQAIEHGTDHLGADFVKGAALASDAFFPFPDCVEECAKAGITAIIQPGGSIKDQASIDACDAAGITMVFTGMRHFRH